MWHDSAFRLTFDEVNLKRYTSLTPPLYLFANMAKSVITQTYGRSRSNTSTKKASSSIGAPSQRTQSSRKGKRAWRKNVDLDEVEEGLEELRAEERVSG